MTDIDALIARMHIEEKAGQLNMLAWGAPLTGAMAAGDATDAVRAGKVGSLLNLTGPKVAEIQRVAVEETRLGIPLFFGDDTIHGHRTSFPIPLAEAGIFDPDIWMRSARIAALESAEDGLDLTFAPMLDVARDPRWGRASESPGEDPWVAARFGEAKTKGFQSPKGLDATDAIAGCAKHFCAYGAVTAGREYAAADVSDLTVRETYLPPFEAAVRAGVATIMPSLNALAGIPMTAHIPLLKQWLRDRLGFDGVVISDYGAIRELMNHGTAGDQAEACAAAIKAGCDIDMMGYAYIDHLPEAVKRGLVTVEEVDVCVRRVLLFKQRLGLFDDPYRRCRARPADVETKNERRRFAREVAQKSLVLLTNRGDLVPIAPGRQRIALIGPLADAPAEMKGPWAALADAREGVSVLAGLREAYPHASITHHAGVTVEGDDIQGIAAAVEAARQADVAILCLGETAAMSGEATSRTNLDLPGAQRALAEAVLATGKPSVAIVFGGRPPIIPWLAESADALVAALYPGNDGGHALADIISGHVAPTGRLAMTWPRSMGQVPIFHGERPNGRPMNPDDHFTSKYIDSPNTPLFPFGHGLSTTEFSLADLRTSGGILFEGKPIEIEIKVANVGPRSGEATVFLFTRDPIASVTRPALELRDVRKIVLDQGKQGTLAFSLAIGDIAFPVTGFDPVVEPGAIDILVGFSADPTKLLKTRISVRTAEA